MKVLALEESPEEPEPSMTDIELESLVIAEDEELENLINLTFKENMYSANIPFDIT